MRTLAVSELSEQSQAIFKAFDGGDTAGTVALLSKDCVVTFGNSPATVGREKVKQALEAMTVTVRKTTHKFVNEWVSGRDTIVEYVVTYERNDGKSFSLPGSTMWTTDSQGLVASYRVYIDRTPLFSR